MRKEGGENGRTLVAVLLHLLAVESFASLDVAGSVVLDGVGIDALGVEDEVLKIRLETR